MCYRVEIYQYVSALCIKYSLVSGHVSFEVRNLLSPELKIYTAQRFNRLDRMAQFSAKTADQTAICSVYYGSMVRAVQRA